MTNIIQDLPKFVDAVLAEFWEENLEAKGRFHLLLGTRIQQAQHGELDEAAYISEQMDRAKQPA